MAPAGAAMVIVAREPGKLVSIVLPTYNGERWLTESIDSCLRQTYPHLEVLVVDDGSQADIRSIVDAAADGRVRYLRHARNQGLSAALNTGFAHCRGGYLTWTSDDNRYHPDAVRRMVEYLESHPEVGLVYAGCRLIDERGAPGAALPIPDPQEVWLINCVRACFLYRRQVYERVGDYDLELPLVEDYDYWLRTARLFSLGRLDAVLYDLRLHPSSLTSTLSLEHKQQLYVRMLAKQRQGEAPVASRTWRRAMASLHAAYGRDYFFAGKTGPARRNLLSAIRLDPAHLLRWGLAGPLLKSLVGDDLLAWIRRGRRPGAPPAGKPFRLLHCYATFGANQGGTERQARLICGALVARGHRVSVLTRRDTGQGRPPNGVAVHACIWTMDRVRLFGTTYLATAIYHLVRLGRRADLLHAHQLYLDAIAALVAGRILRLPVVAKMVGAGAGGDLDRLRKTKGGGVLLRLLHCLDAVVVPSRTCRDELLRAAFPPQRIYLIPNGVDTHAYRPPVGPASSALPGLRGRLVVYTGRLIEAKGLLELLEAWRLVVVEAPDAHLVLVGSGPLEAELRRQAADAGVADCVHFRGEVPDVRPYLQAAAAFVFPSWAEGLPNSLLEAMATGLPCVATRIPPIEELITDGQHGLLVPREAPTALAAALVSVLTGSALAARLGRAARRRVEMEYDLSSALDQLEALYQQLCGKGRRGGIVLNEPPDGRPVATRSECPSHLYEVRRVSAP